MPDVVILSAARTPIGSFQGALAPLSTTSLGSAALKGAIARAGVDPAAIEQVYMGCVLPAGLGQAPARQAALGAGCPPSTGAITINKVCGSGMRAVMSAANDLRVGEFTLVAAGGMESMSNAPYLAAGARDGLAAGARQADRLDDPRRAVGPLRRQAHGELRRELRQEIRLHSRVAGRVHARELPPRPRGG
jgi:acetyl-CoA C-acetyltransferase